MNHLRPHPHLNNYDKLCARCHRHISIREMEMVGEHRQKYCMRCAMILLEPVYRIPNLRWYWGGHGMNPRSDYFYEENVYLYDGN